MTDLLLQALMGDAGMEELAYPQLKPFVKQNEHFVSGD